MSYDHDDFDPRFHEHIRRTARRAGRRGFTAFNEFMGGFGGPGGGAAFWVGRKFSSSDLQLILLSLLEKAPSHGYELIKALEERSNGFYAPSPGVIYPALTYLEEIGYTTVAAEGAKKLYSITDVGRAHLNEHRAAADAMLRTLDRAGEGVDRVNRAFSGEFGSDPEDFGYERHHRFDELRDARHALRDAVREKRHSSPEEVRRIAEILRRAASEIRGK